MKPAIEAYIEAYIEGLSSLLRSSGSVSDKPDIGPVNGLLTALPTCLHNFIRDSQQKYALVQVIVWGRLVCLYSCRSKCTLRVVDSNQMDRVLVRHIVWNGAATFHASDNFETQSTRPK